MAEKLIIDCYIFIIILKRTVYFTDSTTCAMLTWKNLLVLKDGGLVGVSLNDLSLIFLSQSFDPTTVSLLPAGEKKNAYMVIVSKSPNAVMSRPSKRFGLISFLPPYTPISNPQAHLSFRRRQYKNLILKA